MSTSRSNKFIKKNQKRKKSIILLVLFKLYLFLLQVYGRTVLKCSHKYFLTILIRVQQKFLTAHQDKSVAIKNKLAHAITLYLLHGEIPDHYKELVTTEKRFFDKEFKISKKDPGIRRLASDYFRIRSFHYSYGVSTDFLKQKAAEYLKKAKEYDKTVSPLNNREFIIIRKSIKKYYSRLKQEYRSDLKRFVRDETSKIFPKFEIKQAHLTFMISISTAIFLITGYVYNKFFLGAFGIEVSKFFNLSDYIAASMDKLYIAGISAIVALLFAFYGMYLRFRDEIRSIHFEANVEVEMKRWDFQMLILLIGFSILTALYFYKDLPGKYSLLSIVIFFLLIGIYLKLPLDKFIKNPSYIFVFFIALLSFAVSIFNAISNDIDKIKHSNINEIRKYSFQYNQNVPFDPKFAVLLAKTDDFFFFYDKENKISYVIPKSDIQWIESTGN